MITHRLGASIGSLLLLSAMAAGCGDDDDAAATGEPTTTTEADPQEATGSGPDSLPADGSFPIKVDPGRYTLDAIGLDQASIEVDDGWVLYIVGPHEIVLADLSGGPGRHEIVILRPDLLVRPGFVSPPLLPAVDPETDLLPLEDIDAWLADSQEWNAEAVEATEVDGREAVRFTLRPDFTVCAPEESFGCNGVMAFVEGETPTDGAGLAGSDDGLHEFLWVRDVDGQPLVVNIGVGERLEDQDLEWAERARLVMESLELG